MTDRIYSLRQMPISSCPKGVPVLVAGGIAMLKTGGVWFSGMTDKPFTRELNWMPEWWAAIPQENDPLLEVCDECGEPHRKIAETVSEYGQSLGMSHRVCRECYESHPEPDTGRPDWEELK